MNGADDMHHERKTACDRIATPSTAVFRINVGFVLYAVFGEVAKSAPPFTGAL